jgi:hypothetical protein
MTRRESRERHGVGKRRPTREREARIARSEGNRGASPSGCFSKGFASNGEPKECGPYHEDLWKQPSRSMTGGCSGVDDSYPQDDRQVGFEKLRVVRIQLLRWFARLERLAEKIDEAFAGQPFLSTIAPDAPANSRRFNAYLKEHEQVTKLLCRAVELWMLTYGMKREDDWIPLAIEELRRQTQQEHLKQVPKGADY